MTMNPSSTTSIIALLFTLLLSACVAQQNESCSVCGEGMEVGNPDGLVVFPGQAGQIPCGILENMGKLGLIPAPQCAVLPQLISITCECQSIAGPTTTTTTPFPVTTTTTDATKPGGSKCGKVPATTTAGPVTTTEATKPGGSKGGKSIGHSMSVSAKAGKSAAAKCNKNSALPAGLYQAEEFGRPMDIAPVSDTTATASTSSEFRSEDLITLLKWIADSSSLVEDKAEPQGEATEEVEILEDIRAQLVKLIFMNVGN